MVNSVATVGAAAAPARRESNVRRAIVAALKTALALAIVAFMSYTIVTQWSQVRQAWLGLAWPSVLLSFAALIAGMVANVMAWKASLRDLEHEIPFVAAFQINFIGALGKYLPGSVWAYVMQMELGRRAGLPRARAFLASVVTVGLGTTAALGLGTLAVPALISSAGDHQSYAGPVRFALYAMIGLLPVAILCAVPPVLTRLIQLLLRVLRRQPLTHVLTWSGVLRVVAWAAIGWICFGVHLWLLANAQAAPGMSGLVRSVGAFAIAMTISLFAILAPSGLGVREAVLVAALVPALPPPNAAGTALGIALASRILFILADAVTAAAAALSIAAAHRSRPAADPVSASSE